MEILMPSSFIHPISEIKNKVKVLSDKTDELYLLMTRYDVDDGKLQFLIDDIRALAGDIYNDRG